MLGLLIMFTALGAGYWLLGSQDFKPLSPNVSGDLRFVDRATFLGPALEAGHYGENNLFWVNTTAIHETLLKDPAISDAQVSVGLPNRLDIAVTERTPVFAIHHGDATVVVDASGRVLAAVDPTVPQSLGIPVIDDQSSTQTDLSQPGATIDPIELAAILQLGAVTPALVDSHATAFQLSMRDDDGFVIGAQPQGWEAVFGQYTPNLRPTDIIPRQVQCLRSLVDAGESNLQTVYLSPRDEACGTYLPVATPLVPTPTPTKAH